MTDHSKAIHCCLPCKLIQIITTNILNYRQQITSTTTKIKTIHSPNAQNTKGNPTICCKKSKDRTNSELADCRGFRTGPIRIPPHVAALQAPNHVQSPSCPPRLQSTLHRKQPLIAFAQHSCCLASEGSACSL